MPPSSEGFPRSRSPPPRNRERAELRGCAWRFALSLGTPAPALCFYLFQVVYAPAISVLPPPAQVSLIAPTSEEARTFLTWLEAEDPALASQTQRSADARAFQLPKLAHLPSYVAFPPQLN